MILQVLATLTAVCFTSGIAAVAYGLAYEGADARSRRLTPDPNLTDLDQNGLPR